MSESSILLLTTEQHRQVLECLAALPRGFKFQVQRSLYWNLMVSFLLHELATADAIGALHRGLRDTWFPAASAFPMVRALFEIDVTAHYIARDPETRARRYIDFGKVLRKRRMDACFRHRSSSQRSWREGMNSEWTHYWAPIEAEVNGDFDGVKADFGKGRTWSGKSLRQIAEEVSHVEAYDTWYAELSSFAHADVRLADRYVGWSSDGPCFRNEPREADVGEVFRAAATFLTCFLTLFGTTFGLWNADTVERCWATMASSHGLHPALDVIEKHCG